MTLTNTRPRALVTLPDVALPSDTGRRLRSRAILDGLAEHFDLDVIITGAFEPGPERPVQDLAAVRRFLALPVTRPSKSSALARALMHRGPIELFNEAWKPVRRALHQWPLEERYALAWFGGMSHHVGLGDLVKREYTIVDFDDLQTAKWSRFLDSTSWSVRGAPNRVRRMLERRAWLRAEVAIASRTDAVVTADPDDLARCQALGIPRAAVIPNSYPDPGRRRTPLAEVPVVAFVGNFKYQPNVDAARELILHVLPALRKSLPGATLRLIGSGSDELDPRLLGRSGVEAAGRVPEIAPLLDGCTATLMPIRSGGGTRVKAIEAFALGLPVVGTTFAVTGLGAADRIHYLRADTVDQFVQATALLARDRTIRSELQDAARDLYEREFVPGASTRAIAALVDTVTGRAAGTAEQRSVGRHGA